jgi:hypothetical protein
VDQKTGGRSSANTAIQEEDAEDSLLEKDVIYALPSSQLKNPGAVDAFFEASVEIFDDGTLNFETYDIDTLLGRRTTLFGTRYPRLS